MEDIIIARGINKIIDLPPGIKLELLKDANLTIKEGEFVALTGISGSGKSTLLGILLGYEEDFDGTVMINSKNMYEMKAGDLKKFRDENIGICYGDKAPIFLTFTVEENIRRRLELFYQDDIEEKSKEILDAFKISSISNKKVLNCSFLELYRIMFAVAFCGFPPIIIMDEFLDYFPLEDRKELLNTIHTLQKEHRITLILTTIEIDTILKADRAVNIMNKTTYKVDMVRLKEVIKSKEKGEI